MEREKVRDQDATKIRVDAEEWDSPTHKVDCFERHVGLEIEWNNKDPFYDRDLNNFRLLFDLRVIEVGVIVTRASNLQAIFKSLGPKVGNKYGVHDAYGKAVAENRRRRRRWMPDPRLRNYWREICR
jgi:hypothetical protein